jgi:hypothetical protein
MARISTPGIWLPGPLNAINSPSPTGQADIAGNPYFMGMNPGKMIVVGTSEAQSAAAPGTTLYDGAYQIVQLDSGATAANATLGMPAYIRLDSGPTQGALPETAYNTPTVTTADIANQLGSNLTTLFAGVFINPATVNGQANGPTPGNYTAIFVGGGRCAVNYASGQNPTLGSAVYPTGGGANTFQVSNTPTAPTTGIEWGQAVQAITGPGFGVVYYDSIMFRFGGF